MINVESLSSIQLDDTTADVVTIAKLAFDRGVAADFLTSVLAYEQGLIEQANAAQTQIEPAAENSQELAAANQRISVLEQQLAQYVIADWPGLIEALSDAGLDEMLLSIANAARTTPNPTGRRLETEYITLQTNLDLAAREGRTQAVKDAYGALLRFAGELMALNPAIAPDLIADISTAIPALQQVLVDREIPTTLLEFVVPNFG